MSHVQGINGDTIQLPGMVANVSGPYRLPSDNKEYLVFGFRSPDEQRNLNCVFYIRIEDVNACEMATKIVTALVKQETITVWFRNDPPWNGESDPSYVILAVK